MTIKRIVGVKITGELKQWRRSSCIPLTVLGHLDEVEVAFKLKYDLVHYPESQEHPEHYLARTILGDYYYLALEEEVQ